MHQTKLGKGRTIVFLTDGVTSVMRRVNYIWLAYHVFLVISLDWIFLNQSAPVAIGTDGITTATPTVASEPGDFNNAENIYVDTPL